MDELKSRCLDQLEIISKKRLLRTIEGQEMNSSSSESGHDAANVVSAMEVVQESSVVEASQPAPDTREVCRPATSVLPNTKTVDPSSRSKKCAVFLCQNIQEYVTAFLRDWS